MAVCEFHGKYADYLTDQIALKLVRGEAKTLKILVKLGVYLTQYQFVKL